MGLFIVVGGLEITGVLTKMAEFIGNVSGGNTVLMITIILWLSAFASAVVDNIPFAATMVPVIRNLALTHGIDLHTLSWSLALGTDIGGNGTPIGASANVVGTAIAEREGHPISWGRFMKYAMPAMIITVGLCMIYLIIRYV
jgi:Na+/H+ antiporter NhaD/arsenite permease-like protein